MYITWNIIFNEINDEYQMWISENKNFFMHILSLCGVMERILMSADAGSVKLHDNKLLHYGVGPRNCWLGVGKGIGV
jgi:hypothetical protein